MILKSKHASNVIIKNSILVVITILGLFLLFMLDNWQTSHWSEEKERKLNSSSNLLKTKIENSFQSRFSALKGISSLFITFPKANLNEFNTFAQKTLSMTPSIRAIQYADSLTKVRYVYPSKNNEITIKKPMILINDPKRKKYVKKAIFNKITTIQGPLNLRQGGKGVIVRTPIFKNDKFIGLAIGVYDLPSLMKEVKTELNLENFSFFIKSDNGNIFFGDKIGDENINYITKSIFIADKKWILKLRWKPNLSNPTILTRFFIFGFGLSFLLSSILLIFTSLNKNLKLEQIVADRTKDLQNEKENAENNASKFHKLFENNPVSLWEEDFSQAKIILDEKKKEVNNLKSYLDENPDFVQYLASNIIVKNVNSASLKLFNAKSKEELSENIDKTFNEVSFETFKKLLVDISNNIYTFDDETEYLSLKEEIISAKIQVVSLDNFTNSIISIVDVSKMKKNEMELQKMDKLRSIGVLAGGIAHDFNNILTGIYGNISLTLMELSEDHPSYELLTETENSINRASKLTSQLLTFSKGGSPIKKNVNLTKIIKETINFDLSGSNLKPIFNFPKDLFNAVVDEGQIQQVFSNLTINAKQASPDGGHFYISVINCIVSDNEILNLKSGKYLKVTVQDEGIGIPNHHIDKIFDPYFSTKETGTGLGLATTFSIIKKHQGYLGIESELGKGAKFTIYLPASKNKEIKKEEKTKTIISPKPQTAKVLIMDDDHVILETLSKMTENLGYETSSVSDGKQAISKYKKAAEQKVGFDIVIMDLTIPGGMGGKEAVTEILKINKNAKVIVSSGYTNNLVLSDYKSFGFTDKIDKPYTMARLEEVLTRVLNNDIDKI